MARNKKSAAALSRSAPPKSDAPLKGKSKSNDKDKDEKLPDENPMDFAEFGRKMVTKLTGLDPSEQPAVVPHRLYPDTSAPTAGRPTPTIPSECDSLKDDFMAKYIERHRGPEDIYRKAINPSNADRILLDDILFNPTSLYTGPKPRGALHKDFRDGYRTDGSTGAPPTRVGFHDNLIPDHMNVGISPSEMKYRLREGTDPEDGLGGYSKGGGGHGPKTDELDAGQRRKRDQMEGLLQRAYILDQPRARKYKYGTVSVPISEDETIEDWDMVQKYGTTDRKSAEIEQMEDGNAVKEKWREQAEEFKAKGFKTSDEMIDEYTAFGRNYTHHQATQMGDGGHFAEDYINALNAGHRMVCTTDQLKAIHSLRETTSHVEATRRNKGQLKMYDAEKKFTAGRGYHHFAKTPFASVSMEKAMTRGIYGLSEDTLEEFTNGPYSALWTYDPDKGGQTEVINMAEWKRRFPLLNKYRTIESIEELVEKDAPCGETKLSKWCLEAEKYLAAEKKGRPISLVATESERAAHRAKWGEIGTQTKERGCVDPNCSKVTCQTHGEWGRKGRGQKNSWSADQIWTWHDDHPDFVAHEGTDALTVKEDERGPRDEAWKARPDKDKIMDIRTTRYLRKQGLLDEDADVDDEEHNETVSKATEDTRKTTYSSRTSKAGRKSRPAGSLSTAKARKKALQQYASTSDESSLMTGKDRRREDVLEAGEKTTVASKKAKGGSRHAETATTGTDAPSTQSQLPSALSALSEAGYTKDQIRGMLQELLTTGSTDTDTGTDGGMSDSPLTAGMPSMIAA